MNKCILPLNYSDEYCLILGHPVYFNRDRDERHTTPTKNTVYSYSVIWLWLRKIVRTDRLFHNNSPPFRYINTLSAICLSYEWKKIDSTNKTLLLCINDLHAQFVQRHRKTVIHVMQLILLNLATNVISIIWSNEAYRHGREWRYVYKNDLSVIFWWNAYQCKVVGMVNIERENSFGEANQNRFQANVFR